MNHGRPAAGISGALALVSDFIDYDDFREAAVDNLCRIRGL